MPKQILLAQKPYDLLVGLELLHALAKTHHDLEVLVVGESLNAARTRTLCLRMGIPVGVVPDLDMYPRLIERYRVCELSWRPIRYLLAFILALSSNIAWRMRRSRALSIGGKIKAEMILSDTWCSKSIYWTGIQPLKCLYVLDGGYSTVSLRLIDELRRSGISKMVSVSLRRQRKLFPSSLRRSIAGAIGANTAFFSCYVSEEHAAHSRDVLRNTYSWSKANISAKIVDANRILILGLPFLDRLDEFLMVLSSVLSERNEPYPCISVEYRLHPSDAERFSTQATLRESIREKLLKKGLVMVEPEFGLEFDFMNQQGLPATIITYPSSSTVWLREVLAHRVSLVEIK
jgi:hypothetical protein